MYMPSIGYLVVTPAPDKANCNKVTTVTSNRTGPRSPDSHVAAVVFSVGPGPLRALRRVSGGRAPLVSLWGEPVSQLSRRSAHTRRTNLTELSERRPHRARRDALLRPRQSGGYCRSAAAAPPRRRVTPSHDVTTASLGERGRVSRDT